MTKNEIANCPYCKYLLEKFYAPSVKNVNFAYPSYLITPNDALLKLFEAYKELDKLCSYAYTDINRIIINRAKAYDLIKSDDRKVIERFECIYFPKPVDFQNGKLIKECTGMVLRAIKIDRNTIDFIYFEKYYEITYSIFEQSFDMNDIFTVMFNLLCMVSSFLSQNAPINICTINSSFDFKKIYNYFKEIIKNLPLRHKKCIAACKSTADLFISDQRKIHTLYEQLINKFGYIRVENDDKTNKALLKKAASIIKSDCSYAYDRYKTFQDLFLGYKTMYFLSILYATFETAKKTGLLEV